MFTAPLEEVKEVQNVTKTLRPNTFRFPGGTLANYYHPDKPGYGFDEIPETKGMFPEILRSMQLFEKNAIYHFADLCKMSNSSVVYVSNMVTAEVDETVWAVEYLLSQNIPVVGIELGNEFYFLQYRKIFPNAESYIEKAKDYAAVLRKRFPGIPLGVIAADPTGFYPKNEAAIFKLDWNKKMGKENFYDFYTPHFYPHVKGCAAQGGDDFDEVYDCLNNTLAIDSLNYFPQIYEFYSTLYGNKKMWITEWNSEAQEQVSNTIRHAEFAGEYLMGLIDISAHNPDIERAFFHNYGSAGFVSPIFSYSKKTDIPYLKKDGNIVCNATYFPFLYFRQLLDKKVKRIRESVSYPGTMNSKHAVFKTFISPSENLLYLFFINKSSQKVPVEVKGAKKINSAVGIQGNYPWSVAGYNAQFNTGKNVDLIRYIPENYNDFVVPANSVGYFVIEL